MTKKLLSVAITMALVGCGGGSGGSDAAKAPTYTVAGSISSATVAQDAKVCADLNKNLVCDDTDPSVTAEKGEFSIDSPKREILTSNLVAQFTHNGSTATVMAPSRKRVSGNVINGITSLLVGLQNKGMTLEQASALLTSEINRAGVVAPEKLLENTSAAVLSTLDANTVTVLKELTSDNREVVLTALALSLADHKVLTKENPAAAELTKLIAPLSRVTNEQTALNDTGVVLYFSDSSTSENVTAAQSDYPGQDANYGFDKSDKKSGSGKGFDFVKLNAKGETLADTATDWRCVLDKRSGLVWESKSGDASSVQFKDRIFALELAGRFTPYADDLAAVREQDGAPFADGLYTTKAYVDHINGLSLCGITKWRLPTGMEIYNLLDLGETSKDADGNVMGMMHKYFPQQTSGSPDIGQGAVWTDSFVFTASDQYKSKGSNYYNTYSPLGDYRGHIEQIDIYDDKKEADYGTSYQFPVRLVATKESSQ